MDGESEVNVVVPYMRQFFLVSTRYISHLHLSDSANCATDCCINFCILSDFSKLSESAPLLDPAVLGRMNGYGTGSSRAKGKQRAREDDNDGDERDIGDRDGSIGGMDVSIRFTDGTTEDLDMFVNESESVREMKRRVSGHSSGKGSHI